MPRPSSFDPSLLRLKLQASGPASAQALAEGLGVDRVTVQRALGRLGPDIVQLGQTRGTRYAARRSVLGQAEPHVFARLSPTTGVAHEWGTLTALHGGWRLEWASPAMRPDWADQSTDYGGFCEGSPFFLSDLRPQAFGAPSPDVCREVPGCR